MNTQEVIAKLDALDGQEDPERDHSIADSLLLTAVPPEIAAAYQRLVARAEWWASA